MTYAYSAPLRVKPFITAPVGNEQQAFILVHRACSRNFEEFIATSHAYEQQAPSLPFVCQVFDYNGRVVISTTIDTAAEEEITGRIGTNLCIGAFVEPSGIDVPQLTQTIFCLFRRFFAKYYHSDLSEEGTSALLSEMQKSSHPASAEHALHQLVRDFEHVFGLEHWLDRVAPRWLSVARTWLAARRCRRLVTYATIAAAQAHWVRSDSADRLPLQPSPTAIVRAVVVTACAPLLLTSLIVGQSKGIALEVDARTHVAFTVAAALLATIVLSDLVRSAAQLPIRLSRGEIPGRNHFHGVLARCSAYITLLLLATLLFALT